MRGACLLPPHRPECSLRSQSPASAVALLWIAAALKTRQCTLQINYKPYTHTFTLILIHASQVKTRLYYPNQHCAPRHEERLTLSYSYGPGLGLTPDIHIYLHIYTHL